jgi:methylated-DNA-[protein]-cysteine S-methyltransferase
MIVMRVFTEVESPIGPLTVVAERGAVVAIEMRPAARSAAAEGAARVDEDGTLTEARRQLDAYFAGDLRSFSLPLEPRGTPFQLSVWRTLERIPYGDTASYGDIAAAIGAPRASRAVGAANGANPIPIVVPCHRVIGRDGTLTGYGGGLERKRTLLALESREPASEIGR